MSESTNEHFSVVSEERMKEYEKEEKNRRKEEEEEVKKEEREKEREKERLDIEEKRRREDELEARKREREEEKEAERYYYDSKRGMSKGGGLGKFLPIVIIGIGIMALSSTERGIQTQSESVEKWQPMSDQEIQDIRSILY